MKIDLEFFPFHAIFKNTTSCTLRAKKRTETLYKPTILADTIEDL